MPKTQEELNQLKSEYESLTTKLKELSDNELKQVTGGYLIDAEGNIIEFGFTSNEKKCPNCGILLRCNINLTTGIEFDHHCPNCGYTE